MSVYNGERYLREAVQSILTQTYSDFEFIIVDDGSTDDTWELLSRYGDPRIRLVRNAENLGLVKSLNKGLTLARGSLVARQDADDTSLPKRLEKQVLYLERHPEVGLLGTWLYVTDASGRHLAVRQRPGIDAEIRWHMLFENAFGHTAVVFRKHLLEDEDVAYDEAMVHVEDYDLWVRLLQRTRGANLQEPLVTRRMHGHSVGALHYEEQNRRAVGIAARQLNALAPGRRLDCPEVETLREWYCRVPRRWGDAERRLYQVLLKVLTAFEEQEGIDRAVSRALRANWTARMLARLAVRQPRALWTSGLLSAIPPKDVLLVLSQLPGVAWHWLGRLRSGAYRAERLTRGRAH